MSALIASLESFVHKTLKDEQIECIRRIVCHGRDVLAVLLTGFSKNRSVHSKTVVLYGPYSQRHIKSHRCCDKSIGLHPKAWKKWIVESALRLLRNQSRETARSRMESLTLCLEVPIDGSAIDGEKQCSLGIFIRQRSCRLKIKIKALLAKIAAVMVFSFK